MGDLFDREAAAVPEPFTGERLTAAIGGQVQIEHYHRYLFARALCRNLDVLDVASGEGYGAAQLAQLARSVIGVEFNPATVASARRNFDRPNLTYLQGDARALPLADGCVDAVVSFETIEHFDRQEDFVAEIRRVLRPGGLCIVSTPDRAIYSGPDASPNPYHVKELSQQEFLDLLRTQFPEVALLRQRPLVGSALLADAGSPGPPLVFDRRGDSRFEASTGLPLAPYLVAVASDGVLPFLPASLYIERSDLDTVAIDLAHRTHTLAESEAALAEARTTIAALQSREAMVSAALSDAQAALDETQAALAASHAAATAAEAAANEAAKAARAQSEAQAQAHAAFVAQAARAAEAAQAVAQEMEVLRGSARTFLRSYLPRLKRHLLG
ncbi:MAG: class I SAM-dependent methyltransferase [Acetobacteraceae bacterium]|nr:class I SAM-dependent methyltransferase [Acetobacteraceae bacterium]